MTTTVRYIGTTSPYFETAVTGKPGKWSPGDSGDVSDGDAALLIATGLFEVYADRVLPFAFDSAGDIAGVRMPDGQVKEVAPGASDDIRVFTINGANTYPLVAGPGALLSIVLESAATSSPGLTPYDSLVGSGPLVSAAVNVTAGTNVPFVFGVPNVGAPFKNGLCLVVAGAQVGRVTVRVGG